ncbi:MAG: hypothetical protein MR893_00305 [Prevotellaceae bacterium]|nr:hypothetical protein [Prevotellaceae bacterium]
MADSLQNDTSSGVNINLGDANAISGGLHISNVVHERQKHREEIHQESVVKYKLLCEQVYADGVMTSDEARQLENLRLTLGLPSEEANQIREQIRQLRLNQSQTLLNPMQRMTLQQIVTMARNGKIDLLRSSFPRLEAMAQKYDVDEVQFYYYMILAGLYPSQCIKQYEERTSDNYWQQFWTFMAYQNMEELEKAQLIMAEMEAWADRPYGNMAMMATVSSLYTYWQDTTQTDFYEQARMFLEQGADGFSDLLDRFTQALIVLSGDDDENIQEYEKELTFYFNYIFSGLVHKRKMAHVYAQIPKMPKIDPLPR